MSNLNIGVTIGAALSSSFNNAVTSAPKQLSKIGDALEAINRRDTRLKFLQGAESDLEKSRAKLAAVSRELKGVKVGLTGTSGKELEALKKRSADLERQQVTLAKRVESARDKVRDAAIAHKDAAAAADKQTGSLGRLGKSLDTIRERETALQRAMAARDSAQQKLSSARAGLFDAVAIGAGLKVAFAGAGELQAMLTDIGITADIPKEKMKEIGNVLAEVSRKTGQSRANLASGMQVLVAAGLDSDRAVASMEAIGMTATASGASVEDVSRTVFSLLDNLKVAPGEAIKAMDMLTAAGKAGRFELEDMAKYFPAMTADAAKLGLTGTNAVATLGASLQIALKGAADPSEAANNMKNYMAKLTAPLTVKNFAKFGVDLENEFKGWAAKGLDPIEESLKMVQKLTNGDAFKMGELFNDMQVKAFVTPMLQNVDEYKRIKAEVEAATGTVEADSDRRRNEDPTQKWREMGEALTELRDKAIVPLLPPLTKLTNQVIAIAAPVSQWMAENETLVAVLGSTFATLLAGKVAFSAAAYGIGLARVAWTAMNVAVTANPLGLAIKAIALLAGVVWANWDKIGPYFDAFWAGVTGAVNSTWQAVKGAWDGATSYFSGLWSSVTETTMAAWDGVTGFFIGAWEGIKTAFSGGIGGVTALLVNWSPMGLIYKGISAALKTLGIELPGKFTELGSMIVNGLVSGITNMGGAVKGAITGIADNTVGWFKEKLGIQSPSRVFLLLGEMVGQGAAQGIGSTAGLVGRATAGLGLAASMAFQPSLALSMPDLTASASSAARSMVSSPGGAGPAAPMVPPTVTQHFEFHITQIAGEDTEALARRVADLVRRQNQSASRAALGDW
ncbi:phage tail tape measure protein [Alcaligenaceae bacterium]|nr:phage tail tape measure protein [Alcaligenaceae bacterium]